MSQKEYQFMLHRALQHENKKNPKMGALSILVVVIVLITGSYFFL
jgi:hypothetical protein